MPSLPRLVGGYSRRATIRACNATDSGSLHVAAAGGAGRLGETVAFRRFTPLRLVLFLAPHIAIAIAIASASASASDQNIRAAIRAAEFVRYRRFGSWIHGPTVGGTE